MSGSPAIIQNTLTMEYDEALNETSVPAPGDFTVKEDTNYDSTFDKTHSINDVAVTGTTVTLIVDYVSTSGDLQMSYTAGTNPIQDTAGNNAANLTDETVKNNTEI